MSYYWLPPDFVKRWVARIKGNVRFTEANSFLGGSSNSGSNLCERAEGRVEPQIQQV